MRLGDWALLVLLAAVWGGAFVFYKLLDEARLPPLTIVCGRVSLAALALLVAVRASGGAMPRDARAWRAFLVMGTLNNVIPFTLIVFGETRVTSGLASILNATTPIFTVFAARAFARGEPLRAHTIGGAGLGFAGVAIALGPGALHGFALQSAGAFACLAAAAVYGCAAVYGRRFARMGMSPLVAATGQVCGSSLVMLPLALVVDRPWTLHVPTAGAWLAWAGLGLLCTAFAFVIYFRLIATVGAVNAAVVTLLVPISALLLGAAMLGEHLPASALAGMTVIMAGLLLIDGRLFAMRAQRIGSVGAPAPVRSVHDKPPLSRHR